MLTPAERIEVLRSLMQQWEIKQSELDVRIETRKKKLLHWQSLVGQSETFIAEDYVLAPTVEMFSGNKGYRVSCGQEAALHERQIISEQMPLKEAKKFAQQHYNKRD
jgi:hypothetical protein